MIFFFHENKLYTIYNILYHCIFKDIFVIVWFLKKLYKSLKSFKVFTLEKNELLTLLDFTLQIMCLFFHISYYFNGLKVNITLFGIFPLFCNLYLISITFI